MHKKFIALIIATAVTVTGISASQARAADARDILGGLAVIALIGAAVNHYHKEKRKDQVARQQTHVPVLPTVKPQKVRPLPKRVARYDLPQRCMRRFVGYKQRPLLGSKCLNKHYKHAKSLPQQCEVGFWTGNKVKRAYEPACLRQKGYRVVYQ